MFNFRNKEFAYELPERYKNELTKQEYNEIINISISYFEKANVKIINIEDGDLVLESEEGEKHCYLDNLIKRLSQMGKADWQQLIHEHFDRLKENKPAYNYLFKDFEYAAQFLRVLVKPTDILPPEKLPEYINKQDIPGTSTFLVLEFEDQFRYLRHENITEWETSIENLYEIACDNVAMEKIEIKEYMYAEKFPVFIFFSSDYSAGFLLNISKNAPYTIGKFGSLIAIPTKGTAFAHPIEDSNIFELIEVMYPNIVEFYNEDQGNISPDFYWYYEGKFEQFPVEIKDESQFIQLPENLGKLFGGIL